MTSLTKEKYNILANLHSKMMEKHKTIYDISKMYGLYYQKDGTTFIKGLDKSFIGKCFPDDTQILLYPLVCDNKSNYVITAQRTSFDDIFNEDFEDVVDIAPINITISKKSDYIFENVD